jgi:hypothetical protein
MREIYENLKDLSHDIDISTIDLLIEIASYDKRKFEKRTKQAGELKGNALLFYAISNQYAQQIDKHIKNLENLKINKLEVNFVHNIKDYSNFITKITSRYKHNQAFMKSKRNDKAMYSYGVNMFFTASVFLFPCLYKMNETSRYPLNIFNYKNLDYLNDKKSVKSIKNMINDLLIYYNIIISNFDVVIHNSY